jgi:DNA (cytosine-5)-methyltransferase 1
LCGPEFGLKLYRHREFESNVTLKAPAHLPHMWRCQRNGYLPTRERPFMTITGGRHSKAWQRAAAECMGAPWITSIVGICEAIPPAYTEYIGRQLMAHLTGEVAA